MTSDALISASEVLDVLQTNDPNVRRAIEILGDAISLGNVSGSAVALGRNARAIIQHFSLPADQVAALLEARSALAGLDPERYQLKTLLADKTRGFVGRDYAFAAIEHFMDHHTSGYLVVEAEPGLGKSALLAEYVRRTGCIAHFNVRGQGIVRASQFLESVCTQLIVDFGLPYAALPPDATESGVFVDKLLRESSARLAPGERLVIAVDALDEVDPAAQGGCANLLCLPATLPHGVYFVMTRRPVEVPFVSQADQELLDLMAYPTDNRRDVETYLEHQAERPGLRAWIEQQALPVDRFVTQLADLSESNFMYLRYVLPEIEGGGYRGLSLDKLPQGLTRYYEDHWQRMGMATRPLPRLKITIVYIMCEVQDAVSRAKIVEILVHNHFQADAFAVQEVLDDWSQFLHEQPAPDGKMYSIYHASFRDFLHRKDIVQAAGVTIQGIHDLIQDTLWAAIYGDE